MLCIRFALSLRGVEDLLHQRGSEISHETLRYWWNRFGPMFAAEIRGTRVEAMRACGQWQWQWHLDEGACERYRSSPQFLPRSTTIFQRSATSRTATPTNRPAPPLSPSGAAGVVRRNRSARLPPGNYSGGRVSLLGNSQAIKAV